MYWCNSFISHANPFGVTHKNQIWCDSYGLDLGKKSSGSFLGFCLNKGQNVQKKFGQVPTSARLASTSILKALAFEVPKAEQRREAVSSGVVKIGYQGGPPNEKL
jgi:hypothetical protein